MAALQPVENQQRSYEVFEKKHYMECTTMSWRFLSRTPLHHFLALVQLNGNVFAF